MNFNILRLFIQTAINWQVEETNNKNIEINDENKSDNNNDINRDNNSNNNSNNNSGNDNNNGIESMKAIDVDVEDNNHEEKEKDEDKHEEEDSDFYSFLDNNRSETVSLSVAIILGTTFLLSYHHKKINETNSDVQTEPEPISGICDSKISSTMGHRMCNNVFDLQRGEESHDANNNISADKRNISSANSLDQRRKKSILEKLPEVSAEYSYTSQQLFLVANILHECSCEENIYRTDFGSLGTFFGNILHDWLIPNDREISLSNINNNQNDKKYVNSSDKPVVSGSDSFSVSSGTVIKSSEKPDLSAKQLKESMMILGHIYGVLYQFPMIATSTSFIPNYYPTSYSASYSTSSLGSQSQQENRQINSNGFATNSPNTPLAIESIEIIHRLYTYVQYCEGLGNMFGKNEIRSSIAILLKCPEIMTPHTAPSLMGCLRDFIFHSPTQSDKISNGNLPTFSSVPMFSACPPSPSSGHSTFIYAFHFLIIFLSIFLFLFLQT